MKILVVGLTTHPQIIRLQEEAAKRGHLVEGCYTSELVINAESGKFEISLRGKPIDHAVIYFWAVGKRRWEWYLAGEYLAKTSKTVIVNRKVVQSDYNYYLTPASDFLKQSEEGLPFPKSSVIFSTKSIPTVIGDYRYPLIVKSTTGHQGRAVFKVDTKEQLTATVKEILLTAPAAVIREFIPNDGDIRIFTVGYKAIGAMKRTPSRQGEFRSNISQGGTGSKFDLAGHPEIKNIAEKLSAITRTEIAGVDIIINKETGKPFILEINPGPQFTGFEKYTGINAAGAIVDYFEKLLGTNN